MAIEKVKEFLDDYEDDFYPPKKEPEIDIPLYGKGDNYIPTEEQLQMNAMINNVPGNTDIEKQNHLAELERACQNWDSEEWQKIIIHADSQLMTKEIGRRLEIFEKFVANNRSNLDLLKSQDL